MNRKLKFSYTPSPQNGFLGAGHTARALLSGDYKQTDPFILLMDDELDKQDTDPAGGPHPHAGFETVSLLLEGEMGTGAHKMKAGDLQLMTAGSGVVHTESIEEKTKMRLMQLRLVLPKEDRWASPRVQDLQFKDVPVEHGEGFQMKVYSGSFAGVQSPVLNYVPLILVDIELDKGALTTQSLPGSYNGFLYVLQGSLEVGTSHDVLRAGQVGWLDRFEKGTSEIQLKAGSSGTRVLLYAGEPQGDAIVSHGPFIGDTMEDIRKLYQVYREGKMNHITELPKAQQLVW